MATNYAPFPRSNSLVPAMDDNSSLSSQILLNSDRFNDSFEIVPFSTVNEQTLMEKKNVIPKQAETAKQDDASSVIKQQDSSPPFVTPIMTPTTSGNFSLNGMALDLLPGAPTDGGEVYDPLVLSRFGEEKNLLLSQLTKSTTVSSATVSSPQDPTPRWLHDEEAPLPSGPGSSMGGDQNAFGVPTSAVNVVASGVQNINGILAGTKWASTSVSFSFTDSINDYEAGYANRAGHAASFQTLNATQRAVARAWLGSGGASSYYNVSFLSPFELTGASDRDATIRMASSNVPGTAFAYYPSNSFVEGGDAWFNKTSYNTPVIGNYAYHTFGHELGHALGLKHGQELGGPANVALTPDRDSMEFSIMTYRSYVGHDLNALPYYTNETWGFAQSLMMQDIAAIQYLYGAWFGYNSANTTYTFSTTTGEMFVNGVGQGTPGANRVFRTIWDGNGIDTYNLSNYTTNLSIDLTPGGWSSFDTSGGHFQQAMLNAGYGGITQYARGNVFNALQYQGNAASLIENANGGSGNDIITGNAANNVLNGGAGNDTIDGGAGDDLIFLGDGNDYVNIVSAGNDTFYGGNGNDFIYGYTGNEVYYGEAGNDTLLGYSGNDTIFGGDGNDSIQGGNGADYLDGGAGIDTLSYDYSNAAVNVNLTANTASGGDATGDIIVGGTFENLTGSSYNDTLTGSSGNNTIYAGAGDDTVDGGDGNDLIYLGDGNDYLNVSSLGNDTFYGGNGNDYIFGYSGNEIYYGEAGNDTLLGYSGNDTLNGGTGADSLDGGVGTDTLSYAGSSAGVAVNLTTNTASGGDATGDIIVANSFENLTGSSYNDTLTGSIGNNTITAGAGNDTLNGGAGADTLTGGVGNDIFIFQFGQSLVSASDRITDFAFGGDKVDLLTSGGLATGAPSSFSRAANNAATTLTTVVTNVFADANGALAGSQALGVNGAALVVATAAAIAGTYLIVNDTTAGFQSTSDLVVNLTGYTGVLPAFGNITVNSVFV